MEAKTQFWIGAHHFPGALPSRRYLLSGVVRTSSSPHQQIRNRRRNALILGAGLGPIKSDRGYVERRLDNADVLLHLLKEVFLSEHGDILSQRKALRRAGPNVLTNCATLRRQLPTAGVWP